ncbi:MAG: hypothetical protein AAGA56_25775 [Myxococcota bacterium]
MSNWYEWGLALAAWGAASLYHSGRSLEPEAARKVCLLGAALGIGLAVGFSVATRSGLILLVVAPAWAAAGLASAVLLRTFRPRLADVLGAILTVAALLVGLGLLAWEVVRA